MQSWLIKLAAAFVLGVLVAGGAIVGYFALFEQDADSQQSQGASGRKQKPAQGQPIPVKVCRPKSQGMERKATRPASVHSFEFAKIYAHAPGYLKNQQVDIGSVVKQGQLLCEIAAPELKADVVKSRAGHEKSQAEVEVKKAELASAQAELKEVEAEVAEAKADVESDQADLELKQREYARVAALARQKAIQRELVDEKEAAKQSAHADLIAAQKRVQRMQAKLVHKQAGIKQAEANLNDAKAQVEVAKGTLSRAEALLQYTKILAPFAGVITHRGYHNGDFIRDAAETGIEAYPLYVLSSTDKMRVIMRVPDEFVPFVQVGRRAELTVDALPDKTFHGKIARLASSEDYITRTMRVEVDISNKENLLSDGMYGRLTLYLGHGKGQTIPSDALTKGGKKTAENALYVVRDGKAHKIAVEVVQDDGKNAAIVSKDLQDGDRVIWEHAAGLRDGAPVRVVAEGFPSAGQSSPTSEDSTEENNSSGSSEEPRAGAGSSTQKISQASDHSR